MKENHKIVTQQRKAALITFGCQMNNYDSGRLADLLTAAGWLLTDNKEDADFIFFNTCSIREKAAQKILNHVSQLKSLKNKRPELIIAVGGCVAEQEGEALFEKAPWLSLVVGPQHLPEIPKFLERLMVNPEPICRRGSGTSPAWSGDNLENLGYQKQSQNAGAKSAFITIMQGCNNYCAYCVVPYLRGPEMSRSPEDILQEAKSLLQQGVIELTLLGQNVNSYGQAKAGQNFPELLKEISALPGLKRLRFTTSHPKDFPAELVALFGSLPNLCPQLHLPVQSGSDKILQLMGRKYTKEGYLKLVADLRRINPQLALSTDIIVGFPGETEEDFVETLALVEQVGYDSMFSFKYSDRPQTKALNFAGKVPEEEKGRRLIELQKRQQKISLQKNKAHIGQTLLVLVEGRGRKEGQMSGRAANLKMVYFDGLASLNGELVFVKIKDASAVSLNGELCPAQL